MIEILTSFVQFIFGGALFIAAWLTMLCTVGLFFGLMYRLKLTWLVLPGKWISLFAGWAIVASVFGIIETFQHSGGGMITETEGADREGNGGSDYQVWADEWEYKRHECGPYVLGLAFGLFFYVCVQLGERADQLKEKEEQMQEEFEIAKCWHAHTKAAKMQSALEFRIWRDAWKLARKNSDHHWMGTDSQKARWAEGETS